MRNNVCGPGGSCLKALCMGFGTIAVSTNVCGPGGSYVGTIAVSNNVCGPGGSCLQALCMGFGTISGSTNVCGPGGTLEQLLCAIMCVGLLGVRWNNCC